MGKNKSHIRRKIMLIVIVVIIALLSTSTILAQEKTHTVKPGETLFRIARTYGLTVEEIAFANGITNPALIYAGQVLIIPGGDGDAGSGDAGDGDSGETYTVVAGDTMYSIARRNGVTVEALATLNNISDPTKIFVGQVLKLGGTGGPDAEPTAEATDTATPEATETPPPAEAIVHTVVAGETLSSIAVRYNTTYQEIALLNDLDNPNLIFVGQELLIKAAESEATATPEATESPPTETATETPTEETPTEEASPTEETPTEETPTEEATTSATEDPTEVAEITTEPTDDVPAGFSTPTPIASGVEVPADAPNLLKNAGFEGATREVTFAAVQVYEGWEPYYCDLPYTSEKCPALRQGSGNPEGLLMGRPEFKSSDVPSRVRSGNTAQQWFCLWQSCRGGVYQTVTTTPGATCEAGAYVQTWSANGDGLTSTVTDNSLWLIRVDLDGATNAFAEDSQMLVSRSFGFSDRHYDKYALIKYTFMATGTKTTVFFENLRIWPVANNESFIDDAYVRCTAN